MPRHIVKLTHGGAGYYLEWSTVVDAPVTFGMSREEFADHHRREYGAKPDRLPERMGRVDRYGTSCRLGTSAATMVAANRAGPDETELSMEELVRWYCVEKRDPCQGTQQ